VKRVIDGHHGEIEVRSEPVANELAPQGKPHRNRFTLYLPLRQGR
jgi:signal transduction histidine kinase